jgi:hypothetical protein
MGALPCYAPSTPMHAHTALTAKHSRIRLCACQRLTFETHPAFLNRLIRADLHEELHHGEIPRIARQMQGCTPLGIDCVDIGLEARNQLHQVLAPRLGSDQQRPLPSCTATARKSQHARGTHVGLHAQCTLLRDTCKG